MTVQVAWLRACYILTYDMSFVSFSLLLQSNQDSKSKRHFYSKILITEDITRLKVYVNFHLLWFSSTPVTYFCHECTGYITIKYYFKSIIWRIGWIWLPLRILEIEWQPTCMCTIRAKWEKKETAKQKNHSKDPDPTWTASLHFPFQYSTGQSY